MGRGAVGLSEGKLDYPAFILIDELDRCRPSYALEMLETIKHIFEIPRVVFVLTTDTEQLQHAVKSIYGEGFDGKKYFERFFDSQRTLKKGYVPITCCMGRPSASCKQREIFTGFDPIDPDTFSRLGL